MSVAKSRKLETSQQSFTISSGRLTCKTTWSTYAQVPQAHGQTVLPSPTAGLPVHLLLLEAVVTHSDSKEPGCAECLAVGLVDQRWIATGAVGCRYIWNWKSQQVSTCHTRSNNSPVAVKASNSSRFGHANSPRSGMPLPWSALKPSASFQSDPHISRKKQRSKGHIAKSLPICVHIRFASKHKDFVTTSEGGRQT